MRAPPAPQRWRPTGMPLRDVPKTRPARRGPRSRAGASPAREDVPFAVELRDGDPVSELSQVWVAATSGAAVATVV
jgi:hypothetical protein